MLLTMRPTGGLSPVSADRQDWTILDEGQPVGRIYEDILASTAARAAVVLVDHGVREPEGGNFHEREKVATLDEAKKQFEAAWRRWLEWAKLRER